MISSIDDIKIFLNDKSFKKIFILCGKNSFFNSGAKKFIEESLKKKEIRYLYKESNFPELDELIKIIKNIREFKPDLILAIGGGAIIDYAKIANLVEIKDNLEKLIINYSYPFKKNIQN